MKHYTIQTIIFLLLLTSFSACERGGFLRVKKSFSGTVEIIYQTHRSYPDGKDSVFTRTETFTDVLEIKKIGKSKYEIITWESGCDLRICCIQPPCAGVELLLSDENDLKWSWDYDYDNELVIKFDKKLKEVEATYWYSDGYYTDYYDLQDEKYLYSELNQEFYTFVGTR